MKFKIQLLFINTFLLCFFPTAITVHAKNLQNIELHNHVVQFSFIGVMTDENTEGLIPVSIGSIQAQLNSDSEELQDVHKSGNTDEESFSEKLLLGYTIIIDPGHGGKDPGAIGQNGVLEKDLILTTSLKIAEQLTNVGAKVILTRKDDSFVSLGDRVLISNNEDADAFISIHFNSFPEDYVGGINTYYHQNGQVLAHKIQNALASEVTLRDRGVIQSNYRVLRENKHPAILIELGFITNLTELETLQSESYQDKVARAITMGLAEYFLE